MVLITNPSHACTCACTVVVAESEGCYAIDVPCRGTFNYVRIANLQIKVSSIIGTTPIRPQCT